jgi:hypothetical protein
MVVSKRNKSVKQLKKNGINKKKDTKQINNYKRRTQKGGGNILLSDIIEPSLLTNFNLDLITKDKNKSVKFIIRSTVLNNELNNLLSKYFNLPNYNLKHNDEIKIKFYKKNDKNLINTNIKFPNFKIIISSEGVIKFDNIIADILSFFTNTEIKISNYNMFINAFTPIFDNLNNIEINIKYFNYIISQILSHNNFINALSKLIIATKEITFQNVKNDTDMINNILIDFEKILNNIDKTNKNIPSVFKKINITDILNKAKAIPNSKSTLGSPTGSTVIGSSPAGSPPTGSPSKASPSKASPPPGSSPTPRLDSPITPEKFSSMRRKIFSDNDSLMFKPPSVEEVKKNVNEWRSFFNQMKPGLIRKIGKGICRIIDNKFETKEDLYENTKDDAEISRIGQTTGETVRDVNKYLQNIKDNEPPPELKISEVERETVTQVITPVINSTVRTIESANTPLPVGNATSSAASTTNQATRNQATANQAVQNATNKAATNKAALNQATANQVARNATNKAAKNKAARNEEIKAARNQAANNAALNQAAKNKAARNEANKAAQNQAALNQAAAPVEPTVKPTVEPSASNASSAQEQLENNVSAPVANTQEPAPVANTLEQTAPELATLEQTTQELATLETAQESANNTSAAPETAQETAQDSESAEPETAQETAQDSESAEPDQTTSETVANTSELAANTSELAAPEVAPEPANGGQRRLRKYSNKNKKSKKSRKTKKSKTQYYKKTKNYNNNNKWKKTKTSKSKKHNRKH